MTKSSTYAALRQRSYDAKNQQSAENEMTAEKITIRSSADTRLASLSRITDPPAEKKVINVIHRERLKIVRIKGFT